MLSRTLGLVLATLALQGCGSPLAPPRGTGILFTDSDALAPVDGDTSDVLIGVVLDAGPTDRPSVDAAVPLDASPADTGPGDAPDAPLVDDALDLPDAPLDATVDRPDTLVVDAQPVVDVAPDRPDAGVSVDAPTVDVLPVVDVTVDRPDAPVVDAAVDRPDVTVVDVPIILDVPLLLDVAVDRPAVVDVPAAPDASAVPADTVAYTGTFSVRTDGRAALSSLRVLGSARDVWVQMPATRSPNPALVIGFHGTNGDGAQMLSESGAAAVIATDNVIFIAPTSRWFGGEGADFDHPGGNGTYWETANNTNLNTNEDLVLVRAIIQEARRSLGVDPSRVYTYGHSNGGFMAYMVAQFMRDRVVGFGSNSAGLSRCNPQQSCRFRGVGTTCEALATQAGWCNCTGPELPVAVPTTGRHTPGVLVHGTDDPLVSVYHTCTLASLMQARGNPLQLIVLDGGGHYLSTTLARRVWTFLSPYRLP